MKKGHIIATECEFGINDNYHLDIISKLKKADAICDVEDGKLDVYAAMEKIKEGLDDEKVAEKMAKRCKSHENPQFADTTTIFNQANFEVQAGEKICICGAEDDGKSMFLFSILGETELVHGNLKMNGTLGLLSMKRGAFVGGTVRDNITLFSQFKKDLYTKACNIAELNTARMPGDDFMQVSDSGNNLFAKEKVQILVARLIYQNADIFIIDDFFDLMTKQNRGSYSASIIKHCTETQKTLLYVSAYENMAKKSDRIFYFNDCTMIENDTYENLRHTLHFSQFIQKRRDGRPGAKVKTTKDGNFNIPPWYHGLANSNMQDTDKDELEKIRKRAQGSNILDQKLDIKQKDPADGPDIGSAMVNLMKVCMKRADGQVLAKKEGTKVDNVWDTIVVRYLKIDGGGRLTWQIFLGCFTVMSVLIVDVWLVGIGPWWGLDIWPALFIWGGVAIYASFVIWWRDTNIRSSMCENSNTLYRRCIKK